MTSIFEVGRQLSNAREELGTKEFWRMVGDKNLLGYSRGAVGMLMKVASDARLLEVHMVNSQRAGGRSTP